MTACAEHEMALHALIDGELDALTAVALENHMRACAGCREEMRQWEQVREALAEPTVRPEASAALRAQIIAATVQGAARSPKHMPRWTALGGAGAVGALAASLALMLAVPQFAEPGVVDELVAGQVRSLQAGHLVDVVTSNRHVVKPWFNGRINFSPPVADLAGQGFPLVGGRLDVIEGQTVAALVYKRRLHHINLFIRPAPGLASPIAQTTRRDSYSLAHWTRNGLEYWAISDIEPGELDQFRQIFEASTPE